MIGRRNIWALGGLFLVGTVLAGCGGHAAAPVRKAVVAVRQPVHHRTALPSASTQIAMGQLLAVQSVLKQSLSLIDAAHAAQEQELPESARFDFQDAALRLKGVDGVLSELRAPYAFNDAVGDFRQASGWLQAAADAGTGTPARERHAESAGRRDLAMASKRLQGKIDPRLSGVQAAETSALALARRVSQAAKPTPAPHRVHHHAKRPPTATATPIRPTATPVPPTATPTRHVRLVVTATHLKHRKHNKKHAKRSKHAHTRAHPTATPTPPPPTATAVPTSTPRPPTATPVPTVSPVFAALAPFRTILHAAMSDVDMAHKAMGTCATYIDGIRKGTDVTGSSRIHHCLDKASLYLHSAVGRLSPVARRLSLPILARSFRQGLTDARQAQGDLVTVGSDIDAVNLDHAYTMVTAAQRLVDTLTRVIALPHSAKQG